MSTRVPRLVWAVALCVAVVAVGPAASSATGSLKPDPDSTLRFAQGYTSAFVLDPHTVAGQQGFGAFSAVYDRLVQLSPDSRELAPMLAASWKWDSTTTQLTMDLRNDVKFHDGSAFNADVAVQNIKRIAAPGSVGNVALASMTSVVAVDPSTIKLTFSAPNPSVLFQFANFGGMMVSAAGLANPSQLKTQFFGSGAYKLASVDAALTYKFDRNDNYWDKKHVYPAHMELVSIVDENARLNAVRTGVLDWTSITATTYDSAKADKSLQIVNVPSMAPFNVLMNNKIAPFDKPEVRQAVMLALDRDAANASQEGLCPPLNQPFPQGIDGYVSSLKPKTDATKARQMITAAGASGATPKIIVSNVEPFLTFAKVVQAQLAAVGLNPTVEPVAATVSRQTFRAGGGALILTTTVVGAPDPSAYLDQYAIGLDNPGTPDPQLVSKIQAAERLPLGTKDRTAAFQDISRYMVANPVWAPLCANANIFVGNSKVIGLNAMPNAALSLAPDNHYLQIAKQK